MPDFAANEGPAAASGSAARRKSRSRGARSVRQVLLGLLVLGSVGGAAWGVWSYLTPESADEFLTCRAEVKEFTFDITERGELESSANMEVRCEVQSKEGRGMKILEIVPEGTLVQPGDLLIRFEDSGLKNERTQQEIALNSAEAAATQAKNEVESANFAKREYEEGTYKQELEKAQSEVFVAEENLRRAKDTLEFTRRLAAKGYRNQVTAEADEFAVKKCEKELGVAQTKLMVLRDYTREKTLRKHDADINTAEAKQQSEEAKLELERQKLAKIDEQIAKCIVKAPRAGQVVYDHEQDQWNGDEYKIKEGAVVYERRVVIRMPDPTKMQVKAKIAESKIDKLKPGMSATMQIEGLPGVTLNGRVAKVNDFPAQGNWYSSSVKEYETTVEVVDPPAGLRPGMTAQVAIRVEQIPQALQVPLQAVAEIDGCHYCLQRGADGSLSPRPVRLGTSNEKFLVIREGITADDELLLDPRNRLASMTLPPGFATEKTTPKTKDSPAETQSAAGVELSQARP
jgi:HlyD family secretion protein